MKGGAFELLHTGVQRAIWEMGWRELRPIQSAAIRAVYGSDQHVLICAATAGGKTEAAFLPVISKVAEAEERSIKAIYVGPLKALINDQFDRLSRLCERLGIPVHRWHGDVTSADKQALRADPGGILLITPESLESNFINFGSQIPRLYRFLDFVVIDELHAFLGNERGIHLRSLLARLKSATGRAPRMIGLSATLGNPLHGRAFLAPEKPESVLFIQDSSTGREVRFALKAVLRSSGQGEAKGSTTRMTPREVRECLERKTFEDLAVAGELSSGAGTSPASGEKAGQGADLDDIADDLVRYFATSTNLVFVNSRRVAEDLVVRVHDRAARQNWPHDPFLIHHGSVSKEVREETEACLKGSLPSTAICSSTLELGIDIGNVRAVGQVDPPWSVASFVQRLGRSGRRDGEPSIMRLYVRESPPDGNRRLVDLLFPDLIRGIALTRLMKARWLEPVDGSRLHFSTLVHQVLSLLKQTGGLPASSLYGSLVTSGPFLSTTVDDFATLLRHMGARGLIEQMATGELILAPGGEHITSAHDFYAAFKTSEMFVVRHEKEQIGELAVDALPPKGQLLILSGRRWRVDEVDTGSKTVWVNPAQSGELPRFLGNSGDLHSRVVQEMREVLVGTDEPAYLDDGALELLRAARFVTRTVRLHESEVVLVPGGVRWFPWVGTRCLRTLAILARTFNVTCEADRLSLFLAIDGRRDFDELRARIRSGRFEPLQLGAQVVPLAVEKFDEFVPEDLLQRAAFRERLALEEALELVSRELTVLP